MARKTRKTRRRVKRVKGTRRIRRIKTYYKGGNRRQNSKGGSIIDDIKNRTMSLVDQATTAVKKKVEEAKDKLTTPV